jgi:hypothetical protein
MTRILQPELLDELPSNDPRAISSRRDLRRLNAIMGNGRMLARSVVDFVLARKERSPITIAEIGAGEGYIGAKVARTLTSAGFSGSLLLIDRQRPRVAQVTDGWKISAIERDVFDWLDEAPQVDVIVANLFLHHFNDTQLAAMLKRCADLCACFVAAEPHRSPLCDWFSRQLNFIGCNEVTRHDAPISVRAGFKDSELSQFWPHRGDWRLTEKRVGLFTHFFGATPIQ